MDYEDFWYCIWRMICASVVALAIVIAGGTDMATKYDDAVIKAAIEHGYGPAEARCAVMDRDHSCVQAVKIVEKAE
ncbi:hypothetical protein [Komagataeibacter sp. FNDCR2]|uniref:hypothetical protein n=1 Tax=Komagataeibacter sp. FNDCR2 TaxID=2878682 RepID=UPI001E52A18A|nr:hypothetical protein [Komagataeibacter sp. FNDCR2]MCE2576894.1 hypothetical protein [Komagataeibacter sp. FNDCR2]